MAMMVHHPSDALAQPDAAAATRQHANWSPCACRSPSGWVFWRGASSGPDLLAVRRYDDNGG